MRHSHILIGLIVILAFPLLTNAQTDPATDPANATADPSFQFAKDGIFGCNQTSAFSMSVGALSARGTYVPVNDAAVTLNTGYLVYKECVLRGIVDRMRESATASFQKQVLNTYATGRNGQAQFVQNIPKESVAFWTKSVVNSLQGKLGSVNPAFRDAIQRTIATRYSASISSTERPKSLACPYTGDLKALETSPTQSFSWAGLASLRNTNCLPYFAALNASDMVLGDAAAGWNDQMIQAGWGNGTYPQQIVDADGNLITVTPGSLVGADAQMALQTGFQQLQNANDIDQMVGALFAGITSQVVNDSRGLVGLLQPTGSTPSYLDQIAKDAAAGLRNSLLNDAIRFLVSNQTVEQGYLDAMQGIATVLTNTITSLRTKESTCWEALVQNVCVAGTLKPDNTCTAVPQGCKTDAEGIQTCPPAVTLHVATSTAFSQPIVTGQITSLASTTLTNIGTSNATLARLAQMLAAVANTTSVDAQHVVLQQLDPLIAQNKLHTQYDQDNANQTKTEITGSMTTLLSDTVANWTGKGTDLSADASWDGTTYPAVGWCNVSNQTTIRAWIQKWKK